MDQEQIIEEKENESQSENSSQKKKSANSFNLSFSVNYSIHETEKNDFNYSNNSVEKIQKKKYNKINNFAPNKMNKNSLKRRRNIVAAEDQQQILNLASMYDNPFLFGIKHLCDNISDEEGENSDDSEPSESNEESKSNSSSKSRSFNSEEKENTSKSRNSYYDNIKSVEEPIISVEKKQEEKPKKKVMKKNIKGKD